MQIVYAPALQKRVSIDEVRNGDVFSYNGFDWLRVKNGGAVFVNGAVTLSAGLYWPAESFDTSQYAILPRKAEVTIK